MEVNGRLRSYPGNRTQLQTAAETVAYAHNGAKENNVCTDG